MNRKTLRTFSVVALSGALAFGLSSCGGDESDSSSEQMKIALLVGKAGENAVAVDDFANGVQMAVDEINAAGGVLGEQIELQRFAPDVLDPSKTVQAVQRAVGWNPTISMGLEAVPQTRASLGQIALSEAPFIHTSGANLTPDEIEQAGGNLFQLLPSDEHGVILDQAAEFAFNELGGKRVGIIYVDLTLGQEGSKAIENRVKELGGEIVEKRGYSLDDTDLTSQVLAMKRANVDVVVHWGYPNQLAIQLQQFAQNGMSAVPTVSLGIATIVANNKLVDEPLLENLYASTWCNPIGDQPEWSKKYVDKFGDDATAYAAFMYDSVYLAKAAVEEAGTTEPSAVAEALSEVEYTDGVCYQEYKSIGDEQALTNGAIVLGLAGGTPKTLMR